MNAINKLNRMWSMVYIGGSSDGFGVAHNDDDATTAMKKRKYGLFVLLCWVDGFAVLLYATEPRIIAVEGC